MTHRTDSPDRAPASAARPLVVFDLDGTLIDTAPDLVASLNHTIAGLGLAPFGGGDLTHFVGQGARVMIDRALTFRGHPVVAEEIDGLLATFIDHYEDMMPGASKPFPGLIDAMVRLDAAGMGLAVCTNKQEALARRLLDTLGLTERFGVITGGDTFAVRKPDAGHIHGTIDRAGGDRSAAVMIGDSVNDIAAARNAGIPSLAVSFGYSDVDVATLGATQVIDHYDELTPALVADLLRQTARSVSA